MVLGSVPNTVRILRLSPKRPLCAMQAKLTQQGSTDYGKNGLNARRQVRAKAAVSADAGRRNAIAFRVNILFVGDIFWPAGRRIVREHLDHVMETNQVDLLIINGENAAGGFGITPSIAEDLFDLGAHVITTGNHVWDKKEIFEYMTVPADSHGRGAGCCGRQTMRWGRRVSGCMRAKLPTGQAYAVLNLQGRVFIVQLRRSFSQGGRPAEQIAAKVIVVDFHGEATSEKVALGWYLDGRVTAVLGDAHPCSRRRTNACCTRARPTDGRGYERTVRFRDRGGDGDGGAALPDRDADQV